MANRIFSLQIQGVLNASYRDTVLHFQSTGTNDNDTVAAGESLCNGWNTAIRALWLATLPGSYFLVRLQARREVLHPSAETCKYYGVGADPGTRGSTANAQQICPAVFLVPTMGVKSGGRIFWPCIPDGDIVQGVPVAGWQTAVDAVIAALVAGFTNAGITWTLAVFSRKLGTVSNVASHSMSPVVGFQGKRRKPVGAV